jgi:hypothetical protein
VQAIVSRDQLVARMKRSEMRDLTRTKDEDPDCAALYPGYGG